MIKRSLGKEVVTGESRAGVSAHFPNRFIPFRLVTFLPHEKWPCPVGRFAYVNQAQPSLTVAAMSKLKNVDLLDFRSYSYPFSLCLFLSSSLALAALLRLRAIDNGRFSECCRCCFDMLCTRSRRIRVFKNEWTHSERINGPRFEGCL